MSEITLILDSVGHDERLATEQLFPLVYEELRRIATAQMAGEGEKHTLQPTALVHEAWLRLGGPEEYSWQGRAHFFGAAALAMRRILVESARRKRAKKRDSGADVAVFDPETLLVTAPGDHILLIHESLKHLEESDPQAARIVLLKFFSGLTSDEIARISNRSVRSVERQWTVAKAKLYQLIRADGFERGGSAP